MASEKDLLFRKQNLPGFLLLLVVLAGALVRVGVWLQNRSLFLDEANLARNICEKEFAALFTPLNHDQYAPPLFLAVQKLAVSWFGANEYVLRLFPLICGLAGLFFFYRITLRLVANPWVALPVLWIFSFSELLIRYATEGKQYGCDLAVALGLAWLVLRRESPSFRWPWMLLAGCLAPWFSMPAVFVLFGLGLFYVRQTWSNPDRRLLWVVGATGLAWLAGFAVYYVVVLRPTLAVAPLVASHAPWFFPLLPSDAASWARWIDLLLAFPYNTAGFTVLAKLTGAAGLLTGMVVLYRLQRGALLVLVAPVLACLAASGFGQYSLMPRLLVWAFPLLMLVQAAGWQAWWDGLRRPWQALLLLPWMLTAGLHTGWEYLSRPFVLEEIRPVLEAVRRDFQEGDVLYVHHEAWPAVAYYRECYDKRDRYAFDGRVVRGYWYSRPAQDTLSAALGRAPGRVWLAYSHTENAVTQEAMNADLRLVSEYARPARKIAEKGASGWLYVLAPR